jgi:hypothetical protein
MIKVHHVRLPVTYISSVALAALLLAQTAAFAQTDMDASPGRCATPTARLCRARLSRRRTSVPVRSAQR